MKRDDRDSGGGEDYEPTRRTDTWHFEKRLSLDTVVAILGIGLGLGLPILYWGQKVDARVSTLEVREEQRAKQDANRDLDARDQRIAMLTKMEKLDDQVTQLRIEVGKLLLNQPNRK